MRKRIYKNPSGKVEPPVKVNVLSMKHLCKHVQNVFLHAVSLGVSSSVEGLEEVLLEASAKVSTFSLNSLSIH